MSDDALILRLDNQTFADDSFKIQDRQGLVVVAQIANWSHLRWYTDLNKLCGPELKWSKVRHRWESLSHELRRAVLRDLRDALISIHDPSLYRFNLEQSTVNAVGRPMADWPARFKAWFDEEMDAYEKRSILIDSPAWRIQEFLEDDGLTLGDVGGIEGNVDESRSVISELEKSLDELHTVRLFGARSAVTFHDVANRDEWVKAFAEELRDRRYFTPESLFGALLAINERTERVFDEGNQPSVVAIADLKTAIRNRLVSSGRIVIPTGTADGTLELSSKETPMLQAADLAAGYARNLYLLQGLRVVCEEFKMVMLNGSVVRDWSQTERHNSTQLS